MNDDQLHQLLRQAPAQVVLPDSFRREVWSRIEAEDSLTFRACLERLTRPLFALLAQPLPAVVAVVLFMALGGFLGGWRHFGKSTMNEMLYVQSIHPLLQSMEENTP